MLHIVHNILNIYLSIKQYIYIYIFGTFNYYVVVRTAVARQWDDAPFIKYLEALKKQLEDGYAQEPDENEDGVDPVPKNLLNMEQVVAHILSSGM